jgi:hypothetical protein
MTSEKRPAPGQKYHFQGKMELEFQNVWNTLKKYSPGEYRQFFKDNNLWFQKWSFANKKYEDLYGWVNGAIELNDTVWDDLRIVPGAFEFAGASDPTLSNWQPGGAGTTFKVWKFLENDEVFFTCQLPHTYKQGTDIKAHLHWTPCDRGAAESGNDVDWRLDYTWANVDGTFGSSSTIAMLDTCDGTDDKHQMTTTVTISGTGKEVSSMLVCRLYRDPVNDTWASILVAESPALLEFDLHFEIDTMGSRTELTK